MKNIKIKYTILFTLGILFGILLSGLIRDFY